MNRWRCGECGYEFEWPGRPEECSSCDHHHCGDDQCCVGGMFEVVDTETPNITRLFSEPYEPPELEWKFKLLPKLGD